MVEIGLRVIVYASVAHVVLPPKETFKEFPRFQKYYGVLVDCVSYVALNVRDRVSQLYPSVIKPAEEPKKD